MLDRKLIFLFPNQTYFRYSTEPSQLECSYENPKQMFKLNIQEFYTQILCLIGPMNRPPGKCVTEFCFYFLTKTYVVGTQKNRLDETVLLSTQNTHLN